MKSFLGIAVLLAVCGLTHADYTLGAGGYYYNGTTQAYSRVRYWQPPYSNYGVCYPGYYFYQYVPYYPPTPPVTPPAATYTDPGWRSKLLDLATARDKVEGELRKNAVEQQYFLEAVKSMGLEHNFNWQGYGASPYARPGYGGYGNLQLSSAGVNGSSVYGFSYSNVKDFYGDQNQVQLNQQVGRSIDNLGVIFGEAMQGQIQLAGLEGENRAKVAAILAKEQLLRSVLQTVDGVGGKETTKFSLIQSKAGGNGAPPGVDPPQAGQGGLSALWEKSASLRCASCHFGSDKKGGFDVGQFPSMAPQQQAKVIERIETTDDNRRMPRTADNKPGTPVPPEERVVWRAMMSVAMPAAK